MRDLKGDIDEVCKWARAWVAHCERQARGLDVADKANKRDEALSKINRVHAFAIVAVPRRISDQEKMLKKE